jgi:hypothetical protein
MNSLAPTDTAALLLAGFLSVYALAFIICGCLDYRRDIHEKQPREKPHNGQTPPTRYHDKGLKR